MVLKKVIAFALTAAVVCAFAYFGDPNSRYSLLPDCPVREFLGIYCPGCGATRALHALLHLRITEALSQNALFVLMVPAVCAMVVFPDIAKRRYTPHIALLLIAVFAVLRNLEAFEFLAPK